MMVNQERHAKSGKKKEEPLVHDVVKASVLAMLAGVLGYLGGLIIPPSAVYDRLFRQDPNNLAGDWLGSVAGSPASLKLEELPGRLLKGTLTINPGRRGSRVVVVEGNHDSNVVLQGDWNGGSVLKIGLARKVGERFGPDTNYVLLVAADQNVPPALICPRDILSIGACHSLGEGLTFLARERK